MIDFKHVSVMPSEVLELLKPERGGVYVDGTLGGGGHSKLILDALPQNGKLIGIDRDENAIAAASTKICDSRFTAVRGNFHNIGEILKVPVDGILLDLGVSSHQLDTAERGFSYRFDGPLDMRMDNRAKLTAYDVVNSHSEKDLVKLIFEFGEDKFARRIARAICLNRPINTTLQLAEIITNATSKQRFGQPHPAMRAFQAIRIEVNNELAPLRNALNAAITLLNPGGRLVVISFHSLEDRIAKTTFQKAASPCECPREIPYCVCGKKPQVKIITKKPRLPSEEELMENKRAHSSKLRAVERV